MNNNTKIDFIYLSEQDMIRAGVTDMLGCVNTMEEMFGLLYSGDYRMAGPNNDSHGAMVIFPADSPFPNMPKPTADRRMMAMPAYLGGNFCTAGVKWYGSNIANREKGLPRSILMFTLNDPDTGAPLAHMSANLLSAYRTGAIPGVGARHLARKDSKVIGLLGPGVMGKTTVAAFMAVCPQLDTLKIKGRGEKSLSTFIEWAGATYPQLKVIVVDSVEALVRDSDLVTFCNSCATGDVSAYPVVERAWVKPGAFLAMPAACNLDRGMEGDDIRKVVDNTGLYEAWHEELPKPGHRHVPLLGVRFLDMVDEGLLKSEQIEDLGKIIAGDAPARTNEEEIIVLSVGGMPVEDVAWGTVVYRNAVARNIGVKLNLWDVPVLS
ncbi:tyramine oxidase subunit B [Pseudomonas sp. RP23018S]|uniref:tyramine oxidase subunit B n=1 Tax=Pseudomonas sp. RP23018S TaxID=3096037 RepID=UPI002ACAC1AA|nr:tyramine oxidase subunit B [Pseudomonas sp. RP23018S]MDZ5602499.1 tyramine oxidase subunit B [Pseudomonas sp. RP23018S]